jgi:flagellar motor switch protein FliM
MQDEPREKDAMPQDALTQEAIDQLLREMTAGTGTALAEAEPEAPPPSSARRSAGAARAGGGPAPKSHLPTGPRRIRDYDFRRPNRISKEYMRGLRLIHESFAREAPRVWGPLLRAGGQVKIVSMEQTIYEEFRNHLAPHCFVCTATLLPLEGEIAFHIDLDAAFIVIDRLLGGPGTGLKQTRELTPLELNIVQRIITAILPLWREAWLPIIHLEPAIGRTLASIEFLQLTPANESVLVTTFQAHFLNTEIEMTVCIPYALIAPILTRVVTSEHGGIMGNDEIDRDRLIRRMRHMPLEVAARLGTAPIPIADLAQLTVGDVIRLDVPAESGQGLLYISDRPHFVIRPGLAHGNLAVQVTEVFQNRE